MTQEDKSVNKRLISALESAASGLSEPEYSKIKEHVNLALTYESENLKAKSRRQLRLAMEEAALHREGTISISKMVERCFDKSFIFVFTVFVWITVFSVPCLYSLSRFARFPQGEAINRSYQA